MLFFEVQAVYQRQTGEDNPACVKETYMVESLTTSSAEARVIEEIKPFIFGECEVPRIIKRKPYDIFPNPDGEIWFKARVEIIVVEDSGAERRTGVTMWVQADTIDDALKRLNRETSDYDCEIVSIQKTPVLEVFRAVQ